MLREFSTRFTAWSFVAAAIMFWGGWILMPTHIGTFFEPDDFASVYASFHLWIWTFRFHMFGMVITAIALVALASLLTNSQARVMVWPGAAVATSGIIVGAVGAAFYYHHGAWGALEMNGKSAIEIRTFVDALRVDTEYVTCLIRFGRVFYGLGLLVLGFGLIKWKILPTWIGWAAVAIGLAAMALTMLLPDMSLYMPVFHVKAFWLILVGVAILRSGLRVNVSGQVSGSQT
ncbi:MAG: hypothetical protein ACYTBX_08255 [Planctomycetota bacterium]